MLNQERLIEIICQMEEKRCKKVSEEHPCGNSSYECKKCVMAAMHITEDEFTELFD